MNEMYNKKVAIRVDASVKIGTGHLMRVLTLAQTLKKLGAQIVFLCRDLPNNMIVYIEEQGYSVSIIHYPGTDWKEDVRQTKKCIQNDLGKADWLIIDHYGIDIVWESEVNELVHHIMVIDDLANRKHRCDILVDQNLHRKMENRYEGLIPHYCKLLLGPSYALLRKEFMAPSMLSISPRSTIKRLLVFFGGSDPTNETEKALDALQDSQLREMHIDIVVGAANPNKNKIKDMCELTPSFHYYCQAQNMAELMSKADLSLGAGGITLWERALLGLPAITICIAENQKESIEVMELKGAIFNLGWHAEVKIEMIKDAVMNILNHPQKLQEMSLASLEIMKRQCNNEDPILQTMMEVER